MNRLPFVFALTPALALSGCYGLDSDDADLPKDIEGDWQTASALKLAGCAHLFGREGSITIALNPDGACASTATHVKSCRTYSTMKMVVDGRTHTPRSPGGFALVELPNPDGKLAYPCMFPEFQLDMNDLVTKSGSLDIRLLIGDDERAFTIHDWVGFRSLESEYGAFVPGGVATVNAGPRLTGSESETLTLTLDGSDDEAHWSPIPWSGDVMELPVPDDLSRGTGNLHLLERGTVNVSACPFNACVATVERSTWARVDVIGGSR